MPNETQDFELPEDIFQREANAALMSKLICEAPTEGISPAVLQGPWGCGKTTHALRIAECISKNFTQTHKCIYWNAANCDYASDPLTLFIATLYTATDTQEQEKFSDAGFALYGSSALAITGDLINQVIKNKIGVDLSKIGEVAAKAQDNAEKSDFKQFKQFLEEAGKDTSRIETAHKLLKLASGGKELVIIIDELDRCRPDFALRMLETIKHLFSDECCKFLLIMNKRALAKAVQHLYGLPDEESKTYLNKFIRIDFQLPPTPQNYANDSSCSFLYFLHLLGLKNYSSHDPLVQFIKDLVRVTHFQLREVEKLVNTFKILASLSKNGAQIKHDCTEGMMLIIVSYIVSFKPELAIQLINRGISAPDAVEEIFGKDGAAENNIIINRENGYIRGCLEVYLANNLEECYSKLSNYQAFKNRIPFLESCSHYLSKWLNCATFLSI